MVHWVIGEKTRQLIWNSSRMPSLMKIFHSIELKFIEKPLKRNKHGCANLASAKTP
jgi:hypothetical protein